MATVVNTLFPPVIPTFMDAFPNTADATIYFSLSPFNSSTDIKHVHVSVVNQLNNENAISEKCPNGVLFQDLRYDTQSGMYYVSIPANLIDGKVFNINQFYKIQIRFDACDWNNIPENERPSQNLGEGGEQRDKNVSNYLLNYQPYFSEWSSVCLIRPILKPILHIKNFSQMVGDTDEIVVPAFNKGLIPIVGKAYFLDKSETESQISQTETETLQSYQINIKNKANSKVIQQYPIIYTGDNVDPNAINYQIDLQTLNTETDFQFKCEINCTTKNQYHWTETYDFEITDFLQEDKFNPVLTVHMDNENGIAKVQVKNKTEETLFGKVYIKRSSSVDNFKTAEPIYVKELAGPLDITFEDNTVSSLVWYRYSAQFENSAGAFTPVKFSSVFLPDFYDAIISRGAQQYNIKYNYSVSNMKNVVNRAKQDTLGGKYPKFAENAVLNYKQFSITGVLSAEADAYQKFLQKKNIYKDNLAGYYEAYKQDKNIEDLARNDFQNWIKETPNGYPEQDINGSTDNRFLTTTRNDWMWEREFREELAAWLNDGEPKLYRSMAEGSIVVMLTDISLTPVNGTSRFVWNFSATAYEVAEANSLAELDRLGIYKIIQPTKTLGGAQKPDIPQEEYVEVIKVGQLYHYTITNKNDIRNEILQDLQKRYGRKTLVSNVWDSNNVLSDKKPDDLYFKNVKIYFESAPLPYYADPTSGSLIPILQEYTTYPDNVIPFAGHSITIKSDNNDDVNIFVNNAQYYQIPNELNITGLSFNDVGAVVTIEYTLVYKERNNRSSIISSNSISRTIIGQYEGVFRPNEYLGEKIRNKYNFIIPEKYMERMQFWKGICIDATPFALVGIEYVNSDGEQVYEIGHTGVLHLLKNMAIKDVRFFGRRMTRQDISRQPYLDDWEYVIDDSVGNDTIGKELNWFSLDNINTNKTVGIYNSADEMPQTNIVPTWFIINDNKHKEKTKQTRRYATTSDIKHPKRNTVYDIGGQLKIYYHDQWFNFKQIAIDNTNIVGNSSTQEIGLITAPVEGQINYFGTVIKSTFS